MYTRLYVPLGKSVQGDLPLHVGVVHLFFQRCFFITLLKTNSSSSKSHKPKFAILTWCRNLKWFLDLEQYGVRALYSFWGFMNNWCAIKILLSFFLLVIIWSTKLMVRVCFICNITCQDYIDCLVAMALKV